MKFSQKFLIFIFLIFALLISVNIAALKYFTQQYFAEYITSIKDNSPNIEFDVLQKVISSKALDDETLQEYQQITKDLSSITSSLERFSKSPESYTPKVIESLQKIGIPSTSIERLLFVNSIQSFFMNIFNFSTLQEKSPEALFIGRVLISMLAVNAILILFILVITYAWVKYTFRPVKRVTDNISNIIYKKTYEEIRYGKHDEFFPMIEGINTLNKNLSLQEKIRSDFLADFSHEIKTPIAAIKCYLEGIEDKVFSLDEKVINLLHKEIDRLIKISGSIMDFGAIDRLEHASCVFEKNDLVEMLQHIRDEYAPKLKKNKQTFEFKETKKFYIEIDHDKWMQLLHNITSNFIKYSGGNTKLTISFFHDELWTHILFADN